MSKHRKNRRIYIGIAVVVAMMAIISRIYYNSPTAATGAVVEEQQYYVVTSAEAKDTLYAYIYNGEDTVVATYRDSVFLRSVTRQRAASWVNRLWLPSCFGYVAAHTDEKEEQPMTPLDSNAIPTLLRHRQDRLKPLQEAYTSQLAEIDYYLQSHDVQDEGFDVVTRRREAVMHSIDSIKTLTAAIARLAKKKDFSVEHEDRFSVIHDGIHIPAKQTFSLRKGYNVYSTRESSCRLFFSMFRSDGIRPVYLRAGNIGNGEKTSKALRMPADTIVVGTRQKGGHYAGSVRIFCKNGGYYEGQYQDTTYTDGTQRGIRHGFGVAFDADAVHAGKWENDIYQGEQPVYTSNHIYGIDISRYQHEPGKTVVKIKRVKRRHRWRRIKVREKVVYPINWSALRISSLGTKSKKRIDGTVDFPISFIYIKCTEGGSVQNKYYPSDYAQSKRHGYKTGSYHFYSTRTYAAQQAMFFLRHSRYSSSDLPPVLDLEPTTRQVRAMGGAEAMLGSAKKWLQIVERHRGVRPILYVSQKFVNRYLTDEYKNGQYLKRNYQIWIARYGEYKPDVHLVYWQLCPDGRVSGIHGHVDINIFNGYASAFQNFTK